MAKLVRFGVSLDEELIRKFDSRMKDKKYTTRSKALGDLIREELVKAEWLKGKEVAGVITLVYDHHKRELLGKLADIQHDFYRIIISTQHAHLDHDNCLEIIITKGRAEDIEKLSNRLKSVKGVKFAELTAATTGKKLT